MASTENKSSKEMDFDIVLQEDETDLAGYVPK
jgi:hypothetical protein